MSEEMKELQTNEVTETMADYEDHFDDANPWNRVQDYMDKKTVLPVKIEGVVNGGVIVMVEGLRGFVPASKLSLSYIENLEDYLLKDIEVQVIDGPVVMVIPPEADTRRLVSPVVVNVFVTRQAFE